MKVVVLHTEEAPGEQDPVLQQVASALESAGHESGMVSVGANIEPVISALSAARPDIVFNLAESFRGKSALESNIAALLNLLGLHYTGSSPAGLMLAGDKTLAKKILGFHGIRTPESATMFRGALDWSDELAFPVIVKPPQEDASLGITSASVVHDLRELFQRLDVLQAEFQQPVLVERYIEGREFYVGVLGNANAESLPPMELDFSMLPAGVPRIASWEAKWGRDGHGSGAEFAGTRSVFPAELSAELAAHMQEVAVDAFHALRLRDYARIDLRVTENGDVYVIEVNPNCYLERTGEFAQSASRAGLNYEMLIARVVELAAGRYSR